MDRDDMRGDVAEWVRSEVRDYVTAKFPDRSAHDASLRDGWGESDYARDVGMYLHRADTLGIATPNGHQALLKALTVLFEGAVAVGLRNGKLPPAGRPSGDVRISAGLLHG